MELIRQHLIDPDSCIRCSGCEMACLKKAISQIGDNVVVDANLCDNSGDCIEQCPTGSISFWRVVEKPYSLEEQAGWGQLPPQQEFPDDAGAADLLNMPAIGHGPPSSAPTPVVKRFGTQNPAIGVVVENTRLTAADASDIRHLVFAVDDLDFEVLEGQSIGVLPPGRDPRGQAHPMRVYSVASPRDGEGGCRNHVAFTVKRVAEDRDGEAHHGLCSNYLCDLKLGEQVRLVGPYGESFLMPDDPKARIMMICTGTGVAPMRGIIERQRSLGLANPEQLLLFYGARRPVELPYHDDLLPLHGGAIDLNLAFSRVPERPKQYVQDLLLQRRPQVASLLGDADGYVYLCGLRGMEDGVLNAFAEICTEAGLDWPALQHAMKEQGRLHIETY